MPEHGEGVTQAHFSKHGASPMGDGLEDSPIGLIRTFCDLGLFRPSPPSFPLSLLYGLKAVLTHSGSLPVMASHQDSTR